MIIVQEQAFDVGAQLALMKGRRTDIGGTALFVGSVRDLSDGHQVSQMTLEHYPGMTEAELRQELLWKISWARSTSCFWAGS